MYILNPVSRCDIGVRDIIVNDFIPKESYLEWLKINNPNQYKENMTKDMVIRQKVYSFLYRQNFFNPNADYLYALDDEDECFITFSVNMIRCLEMYFFSFFFWEIRLREKTLKFLTKNSVCVHRTT